MSYQFNNAQKMNDIIFANRNKNYGAYEIRASYGQTLLKSVGIVMLGFGSIFLTAFYLNNKNPDNQSSAPVYIRDSVYIVKYGEQPEPEKPKTEESSSAPRKQELETKTENSTVIKDSVNVAETSTTSTSKNTETLVAVDPLLPGGTGAITNTITFGKEKTTAPGSGTVVLNGFQVDRDAEFEGGLKALNRFIGNMIRYPKEAIEEGKGGTIYVKFVVDENGEVGSVSLYNKLGYGMDEETIRVVSLIPKFKSPAMVAGSPVKVYFQLPVNYKIR